MKNIKQIFAGVVTRDANVSIIIRDKFGNIKPIWQENKLCSKLLKKGWLSPLWLNQSWAKLVAPFLGHWATCKDLPNTITNAFLAACAAQNGIGGVALFNQIGIGTGTNAALATDTTLQTEVKADGTAAAGVHALASTAVTASQITQSQTNDTLQLVGTINVTGNIAITEIAFFNNNTNGTMGARQIITVVNVVSGDTFQPIWKIKNQ